MLRITSRAALCAATLFALQACGDDDDEIEPAPDAGAVGDGDGDGDGDGEADGGIDAGGDGDGDIDAGIDAAPANSCPQITATVATPSLARLGETMEVASTVTDADGDSLTYAWSVSSGDLSSLSDATTTYTCTRLGKARIRLLVTDGHDGCQQSFDVDVNCDQPYLMPVAENVTTTAILTAGDAVGDYKMVGIPDGEGIFDNGDGTFTLLSNHELTATVGVARSHGGKGAFVSRWTLDKETLAVTHGEDLVQSVQLWNAGTTQYEAGTDVAFGRFCSADLAPVTAFYDAESGKGTQDRLFLNGEETGDEGRPLAHGMDGVSHELPALGNASWENIVANPQAGEKTIVIGTDDTSPDANTGRLGGKVYVYVGTKTSSGSVIEKAGLANGTLYGIKVTGYDAEDSTTGIPADTAFTLASFGDATNKTGAELQTAYAAAATYFQRPEDGAWDPAHPTDFYFTTTNAFDKPSRLWRLRFADITAPEDGGTITAVLDGSEGQHMLDNLAIDARGHILLQEDPGAQDHLAKVWRYDIAGDTLVEIAQHDAERFSPAGSAFLTKDEESSGVVDASAVLGAGWWLLAVQAHLAVHDPAQVEMGQFIALYDPGTL
jgi:hypothetical protein